MYYLQNLKAIIYDFKRKQYVRPLRPFSGSTFRNECHEEILLLGTYHRLEKPYIRRHSFIFSKALMWTNY